MSIARVLGVALVLLGAVATCFPQWFSPLTRAAEPTADLFEAVERRVRAGMVLGAGLMLLGVPALRPWSVSVPTAVVYVVAGALAARIFGLLVDGVAPKQWLLVVLECVLMAAAAGWLWWSGGGVR
jgi:hypothetical protein